MDLPTALRVKQGSFLGALWRLQLVKVLALLLAVFREGPGNSNALAALAEDPDLFAKVLQVKGDLEELSANEDPRIEQPFSDSLIQAQSNSIKEGVGSEEKPSQDVKKTRLAPPAPSASPPEGSGPLGPPRGREAGAGPLSFQVNSYEESGVFSEKERLGFWKRFGFSGRPSCPARSPSAERRRRHAAAATGTALLQSQLQQQQRWLLLLQRRKNVSNTAQEQQGDRLAPTQQHFAESQDAAARRSGGRHTGSAAAAPAAAEAPIAAAQKAAAAGAASPVFSSAERAMSPSVPAGGRFSGVFLKENHQPGNPSCPLKKPVHGLLASADSTCRSHQTGDFVASRPFKERPERLRQGEGNAEKEFPDTEKMRFVIGGFEIAFEEVPTSTSKESNASGNSKGGSFVAFFDHDGQLAAAEPETTAPLLGASRGAAVGEGDVPAMTWILGSAGSAGEASPAALLEEKESLFEALEYSFELHAEEVARERKELGLVAGHAPAGAPQYATLQFNMDSVPLHEQRLIQAEGEGGDEALGSLSEGGRRVTPAQVQLFSNAGTEAQSLSEDGHGASRGFFDEWVRGLEGPGGPAALQLFSLSLEDLRVILALEEETGGPMSLVTVEDWGASADLPRFLKQAGGPALLSGKAGLDGSSSGDVEEAEDELFTSEDSEDDDYWDWLVADAGVW